MWKGCAAATACASAVLTALLAREGMTGPTAAFEGQQGIWEQVSGPFAIGPRGGQDGRAFTIEETSLKLFPSQYDSQAIIWMGLQLHARLRLDEIAQVAVQTYHAAYHNIGSEPQKWDPRTRETADHSLPYLLAVALQDGAITPATFELARIQDPALRPLMSRITVMENAEFTHQHPQTMISEITVTTRSGERLIERSDYAKGHARNPMTDTELEDKFRSFAEPKLGPRRCRDALDALWHLAERKDLGPTLDLLRIPT
jgi:2-methylcitrate dehydratase